MIIIIIFTWVFYNIGKSQTDHQFLHLHSSSVNNWLLFSNGCLIINYFLFYLSFNLCDILKKKRKIFIQINNSFIHIIIMLHSNKTSSVFHFVMTFFYLKGTCSSEGINRSIIVIIKSLYVSQHIFLHPHLDLQ